MERKYTVSEIDELRNACKLRYIWGTTAQMAGFRISSSYKESEMDKAVEEQIRTYMIAGITAEDIYKADTQNNLPKTQNNA